jgi:hypothetical protein
MPEPIGNLDLLLQNGINRRNESIQDRMVDEKFSRAHCN